MANPSSTVSFDELSIDRRKLNGSLRGARNKTMLSLIGSPRGSFDQECRSPTNTRIANLMVTGDIGPFRVTGLRVAVGALRTVMTEVKHALPDLHDRLTSAGMLCCRNVRGSKTAISNHSWGTALDMKIDGKLDKRGDGRTQRGLLDMHPIFNRHKFYWGAAFGTEDSMHFEASDQLIREWAAQGVFGGGTIAEINSFLDFGDRGPEVEELQEQLNLKLGLDMDTDGIFGRATRAAVMEFQRENGLTVDGVVGPNTKKKLEA